jgi:hypothetical protein
MKEQIKCYCGHTTYCDCGPLQNSIEWLYEQLTSTWYDKSSSEELLATAKQMYQDELNKNNMKHLEKTVLSASAAGVDVSISLSAFCTAHELTDAFASLLSALTFAQDTIEEAFLQKAEEVRQIRLERRKSFVSLSQEDDCN